MDGPAQGRTKEDYAEAFQPLEDGPLEAWCGEYIDLFSPDDKNPDSRRFIDLRDGELQVSADTGGEQWGRRFHPEGLVNPVLAATDVPGVCKTSFLSKVPKDAPIYEDVLNGALDFTLTLGMAFGTKVIKWSGVYDGKGGKLGDETVPPSDCDNFWACAP
mmetsp:Transcript_110939/g.324510  ORF Transcript_110939/g.324510 Transcript_110939/m.324510 type:complete len:160 (-) Transcript_110939:102-581(-)